MPSAAQHARTMAANFEEQIAAAVADRVIPGVVLLAESADGARRYEKVLGHTTVEDGQQDAHPLALDSVFMFMSMSKLVTAVAVLQALEQDAGGSGLGIDSDVAPWLPELAALPVLQGFDGPDGAPRLVPRTAPLTLRHLLTHSSGVAYDFLHPDLVRYGAWAAAQPAGTPGLLPPPRVSSSPPSVEARFRYPLVFQPGAGWAYGAGIDWAGRLVERVRGQAEGLSSSSSSSSPSSSGPQDNPPGFPIVPLEALVVRDILAPLGLPPGALTFHPERYPAVLARLWPSLPVRPSSNARAVVHGPSLYRPAPAALGGQGMYGDMPSFLALLRSLLRDDGRLLAAGGAASRLLCSPLLPSDAARAALLASMAHPEWVTGDVPPTGEYDWAVGGLLVTGSAHAVRRKGAVFWAGAINLTWILDRDAGVCAIFASNYLPAGDAPGKALMAAWEAFVYPETARL